MKSIFVSKTFWVAFIQIVIGGLIIFATDYPDWAGSLLLAKSLLDIVLRTLTTAPVKI